MQGSRSIRTDIAAHRGGAGLWPENSAAAFRGTAGLDVEQIEFDVQLTADSEPVIFHDGTLDRMTDGHGPLAERTLAELETLEIRDGGGRIQRLDAGLDLVAPSSLVLRCELKPDHRLVPYPGIVEKVTAALDARGLLPRTVFTSFHLPTLAAVAALGIPVRGTAWLITRQAVLLLGADMLVAIAERAGVRSVGMNRSLLDDDTHARLREAGIGVAVYGAVEEADIEQVLRSGIELFTTDWPDVALSVRARMIEQGRFA